MEIRDSSQISTTAPIFLQCTDGLKCSKSIRKDGSAVQIIDKYPFGVNELTFEGFVSVGCLPFARLPVRFLKVWKVSS